MAGAARHRVKVNIWNAPDDFTLYKRAEHPDKYRKPIASYIAEGLRAEFSRAGFAPANAREGRVPTVVVDAYVNQFDLGYEKYWWTSGIYIVGYSRVTVVAIADLSVEVTLSGRGERYRRRFVARSRDHSRLLWIGPLLPIIPVPISGFYDEAEQLGRVSTDCFGRVVRSVEELVKGHGG